MANELFSNFADELKSFVRKGNLIIGICNGFQVLVKMGLLPDTSGELNGKVEATLSLNDSGKFEDRWVYLKKPQSKEDICIWTKNLPEKIYVPVAHAEGKFIPGNDKILKKLKDNGQVVFRYVDIDGNKPVYPQNPNGSTEDIAGICDTTGRIMGMMPHPERHFTYLQHPHWQRADKKRKDMGIGLQIFKNGVNFFK